MTDAQMEFELGLDVIRSYRRLSYTHWHALAEFVDNSTQSFFNNRELLEESFAPDGETLEVSIVFDKNEGLIRIADNAMGMSRDELRYALHVGARPEVDSGRSQFGMGMKTAASWLGGVWTVRTKKLGHTTEYMVTVNVEEVASGDPFLPLVASEGRPEDHYTVIEIRELNRSPQGRTLGKIREFLSSMYRQDFRNGDLVLTWQGQQLTWEESDEWFLTARDGTPYKKQFMFEIGNKRVVGWVGVLAKGSRAKAGFSVLHRGRVVRGWPDSWRPEIIFGQLLGSNDLVNQRIIGEIALDDFQVTHTKDDILWFGDEEEQVQKQLQELCADYVAVAKKPYKAGSDERGPSTVEIRTAVDELERELSSDEMADVISIESVPAPEVVKEALRPILESIDRTDPTFDAFAGDFEILGYLAADQSPNDPYVVVDSTGDDRVLVVINMRHPHVSQVVGSEGMLNYLRHCTYDAIAEWQARHKLAVLDSDTVKLLKDRLLRVPLQMEMREAREIGIDDEAV